MTSLKHSFQAAVQKGAIPLLCFFLSLLTSALLLSVLDIPVKEGLSLLLLESTTDLYGLSELLLKVSPIALCALGILICCKAGVWNIGAEGQYVVGAISGAWLALSLNNASPLFVLCLGMLGGMLLAFIAAWLKAQFSASEVLTTIMLNYIAINILMFCVNGPLKDPKGFNFPESAIFSESVLLPSFSEDFRLNVFILFVPLMAIAIWFFLAKTRFGFELKVVGVSESAASNAGISVRTIQFFALIVSGGLAGLAGAAEVIGPVQQLIPQIPVGYGYTAILCVFLGRENPFGILLAAIGMGVIYTGSENLQIEYSLPGSITFVFQGFILFYLLLADYIFKHNFRVPAHAV